MDSEEVIIINSQETPENKRENGEIIEINDSIVDLSEENNENITETNNSIIIIADEKPEPSNSSKEATKEKMLIDINFRNKKTYFAFHEDFLDIIRKYYKEKLDDLVISDDPSNNRICISEKLVKKSDSFLIDTTPNISSQTSKESTPRYTSFSKTILSSEKAKEDEENVMSANKCFNCNGAHSLRDCKEPRNLGRIRKARNEFNKREMRYHDESDDLNLTPGQISSELQAALGLSENQLPLHVYKMRKYGYPPAWLEEAKIYYREQETNEPIDKLKFDSDDSKSNFKYDVQKIYDFPGFNVPPEFAPFVDKHRLLNLPPMLPQHSKEEFILSLGDYVGNGYKRRKLQNEMTQNDESTNIDNADMEIENDNDVEYTITDEIYDEPEEGEISSVENHLNDEDLEMQRSMLLSELSEMNKAESLEPSEPTVSLDATSKEENENEKKQHGKVETTIFGCPLIPSFSPFNNLPAGDKFQEGVSDVIAFENLAESTGKYEKMKGLISKVRNFIKDIQKE